MSMYLILPEYYLVEHISRNRGNCQAFNINLDKSSTVETLCGFTSPWGFEK